MHRALLHNLRVFGPEYSLMASNEQPKASSGITLTSITRPRMQRIALTCSSSATYSAINP